MIEVLNGRHLALIEPDWIDDEIVNGESAADRWSFQRWSDRRLAKANRPVDDRKWHRSVSGIWRPYHQGEKVVGWTPAIHWFPGK